MKQNQEYAYEASIDSDKGGVSRDDVLFEARRRIEKLQQATENTYAYFTELDPTEEKEIFAEEDEEDQDYQILNELDLRTN